MSLLGSLMRVRSLGGRDDACFGKEGKLFDGWRERRKKSISPALSSSGEQLLRKLSKQFPCTQDLLIKHLEQALGLGEERLVHNDSKGFLRACCSPSPSPRVSACNLSPIFNLRRRRTGKDNQTGPIRAAVSSAPPCECEDLE